ncbi:nucleolar pre-ribosomal-associated protein 1-like isoform 2-T3 [Acridotheres tristis]
MPAHDADTDPTGAIFGGVSNRADISFSPVLRDSGAFEYTWKELSIWLEHLDNTKEDQKEAVIQFLERILLKLVTNPYPYTDKAADLVQAASVLQVALFKQDSDNISIPVSHIDDVLDMVDVLIEDSNGFDEEVGFSLNEDMIIQTFPFSAVVPAALEARNKQVHVGLDADPSCWSMTACDRCFCIPDFGLHRGHVAWSSGAASVPCPRQIGVH